MSDLSKTQIEQFWEEGYLLVEGVIDQKTVTTLNAQLDEWLDESRNHTENYGNTTDDKRRFDLDPKHTADNPRLRRVASPAEVSEVYRQIVVDSCIPDMVAQLIGPAIRLHHCKIISKSGEGEDFNIDWHQDQTFDPHTNSDTLAAGLLLTDVNISSDGTEDQGPLQVVPRSHKERHSLFQNNEFTGSIDPALAPDFRRQAVPVFGPAGTVSFHHGLLVHASQPNKSKNCRTTLYAEYVAADAFPLTEPATGSSMYRMMVRGENTRMARMENMEVEIPGTYEDDSFFSHQEKTKTEAKH